MEWAIVLNIPDADNIQFVFDLPDEATARAKAVQWMDADMLALSSVEEVVPSRLEFIEKHAGKQLPVFGMSTDEIDGEDVVRGWCMK